MIPCTSVSLSIIYCIIPTYGWYDQQISLSNEILLSIKYISKFKRSHSYPTTWIKEAITQSIMPSLSKQAKEKNII